MAALTALLPVVLANNQTTSSIATNSQSTTAENNAPSSFIEFNGSDQYMMIPHHADFMLGKTKCFRSRYPFRRETCKKQCHHQIGI